jgi:hypothetical protein
MLHYPNPMHRAQAELDTVVGADRLPTFGDAGSLPYVRALIKEVTRCVLGLSVQLLIYLRSYRLICLVLVLFIREF